MPTSELGRRKLEAKFVVRRCAQAISSGPMKETPREAFEASGRPALIPADTRPMSLRALQRYSLEVSIWRALQGSDEFATAATGSRRVHARYTRRRSMTPGGLCATRGPDLQISMSQLYSQVTEPCGKAPKPILQELRLSVKLVEPVVALDRRFLVSAVASALPCQRDQVDSVGSCKPTSSGGSAWYLCAAWSPDPATLQMQRHLQCRDRRSRGTFRGPCPSLAAPSLRLRKFATIE